jgi:putative transcriptional regulator
MPTANNSKRRSQSSKPKSPQASELTTKLGNELVKGLQQAAAHFRGELKLRSYEYRIPERVNVRALRQKIGLSQGEFAARYALNARTVQEWEQGRAEPDLATRAYLTVIDRNPKAVEDALAASAT